MHDAGYEFPRIHISGNLRNRGNGASLTSEIVQVGHVPGNVLQNSRV